MELEKAQDIVTAINARQFFTMGIVEAAEVPSLTNVSLRDMLDAVDVVEADNAQAASEARGTGTTYNLHVVPAARLIAAVFCIEHYQPNSNIVVSAPSDQVKSGIIGLGVVAVAAMPSNNGRGD